MSILSRRQFLAAGASAVVMASAPRLSLAAASAPINLSITRRTIEVAGKSATVFGLVQPDGTSGVIAQAGDRLRLNLTNRSGEAALIHWHGQTPPVAQDGVPGIGQEPLANNQSWNYDFPLRPGTHWMHSHHGLQEQNLMAAPLIVREDPSADIQEAVVLLHDFTFTDPAELLSRLQGSAAGMGGHGGHSAPMTHTGAPAIDHEAHMRQMDHTMSTAAPGMPFGHANDIEYDAYLANDRTLDDPEVVQVDKGGRVRLRLINGATATAFWINTGALTARVLTVDGNPVLPVSGTRFPLAMGQRLDLLVEIPREGGAFPILAEREGAIERTGVVLVTKGADLPRITVDGETETDLLDLNFERSLRAAQPLPKKAADRHLEVILGQAMGQYLWTLNGRTHGQDDPIAVRKGERVEITFINQSMMMHPMHLHGHHFQVVAFGGERFDGPVRDTVITPSGTSAVTIAFDADNSGRWPLHCHNLFHMAAGMMTTVNYG